MDLWWVCARVCMSGMGEGVGWGEGIKGLLLLLDPQHPLVLCQGQPLEDCRKTVESSADLS